MVWRCHTDEIISGVLGQTYLTSREIREVVMKTAEPVSVRGSTDRMVKIIYSVYAKEFECLFDGTLLEWDTETVNLELKPNYKPFNCKHYLIPRINKETPFKDIQHVV